MNKIDGEWTKSLRLSEINIFERLKKNERNWSLVPLYKPPYLIENQNWRLHLKYLASCLSSNRNFNNVQKRRIPLHGPQFFLTFKLCHVLPRHFCYCQCFIYRHIRLDKLYLRCDTSKSSQSRKLMQFFIAA